MTPHLANRWRPVSARLLKAIAHSLKHDGFNMRDVRRWWPEMPESRRLNMTYNWLRRGYFVHGPVKGSYKPTAKSIRMLDSTESATRDGLPEWHGLQRVYEYIRARGLADLDAIAKVTGMTKHQARNRTYLWARQGLLRRSHHNTYRLPKEPALAALEAAE